MSQRFSIGISRVVELLGLFRDPRSHPQAESYMVQCPFCSDKKWHMNVHTGKETYRCVLCGTHGGALDLYGRVAHGTPCISGPNGNSKKLYVQLCADLNLDSPRAVASSKRPPAPKEIIRAEDVIVHNTYKHLLSMPEFALSDAHQKNLQIRGMDNEVIVRNRYRSFSLEAAGITLNTNEMASRYYKELRAIKRKIPGLAKYSDRWVIAGLEIGRRLQSLDCEMKGVPGFFKLGDLWCFRIENGMYIPTRNMDGRIVSLQVRKDWGDVRYKTISSKGLPEGVTTGISRTHFPIGNASLKQNPRVILTEGPLKADVALELMDAGPCYFMAIHGVNNTAELGKLFQTLRASGITNVENALDMDKITNPNVSKASKTIRKIAKDNGVYMSYLFWGDDFAAAKEAVLEEMCRAKQIAIPQTNNKFLRIGKMTEDLHQAGVEINAGWDAATKGIDDFLLHTKK